MLLPTTQLLESEVGIVAVSKNDKSEQVTKTLCLDDDANCDVVDDYEGGGNVVGSDNDKYFSSGFKFESDPANWSISEELRDYVDQHGASKNRQAFYTSSKRHYPLDKKDRYLTDKLFFRQLKNGELINRNWMSYSERKGSVFCVPCMLFSSHPNANAFKTGLNDCKNASQRVLDHENSPCHKTHQRTFKLRCNTKGRVSSSLADQLNKKTEYWRNVLERVVAAVKFLSIKGLAFRGRHEHLGLLHQGNFLGLIEFLSELDPFLAEHLKLHGDGGSGSTSYISKSTYEEVILLMAQNVRRQILNEAKKAKYFGIVVDSTSDISHIDQLTFVLRSTIEAERLSSTAILAIESDFTKKTDYNNIINEFDTTNSRKKPIV